MDQTVLEHRGPWTERGFRALAPAAAKIELVEGTLFVGPATRPERDAALAVVRDALEQALPDGLRVLEGAPLRMGTDCVLVPDVVVARAEAVEEILVRSEPDDILDCADVLLVVDVLGAEHGVVQRSFRPQLYARSRIPYGVVVDFDAPFAVANMIIGGRYHEFARAEEDGGLALDEPFRIEFDLAALAPAAARTEGQ